MSELISQLLSLISQLAPSIIPLVAVYLGWKLGNQSERRRRAAELLENRFEAFRQLKNVIDNIPLESTVGELTARLKDEAELLNSLRHRLTRLFGLRTELVPYIDDRVALKIDQGLRSLYRAETGKYEMKADVEDKFAQWCIELVAEINRVEKELVALHREAS